jgi:hypothetical protein
METNSSRISRLPIVRVCFARFHVSTAIGAGITSSDWREQKEVVHTRGSEATSAGWEDGDEVVREIRGAAAVR